MAELFADFEVNRASQWPVVSKLPGASVAVHLLAVVCVLYIPGLRDAFNVATLLAGTSFVDRPYVRTEIGDDVQLVDLTSEKFHYPEGYFAPEGAQANQLAAFVPPAPFPPQSFSPPSMPIFRPTPVAVPSPQPVSDRQHLRPVLLLRPPLNHKQLRRPVLVPPLQSVLKS